MNSALRMPEEMTRCPLDHQTYYMDWDYSPQSKTRADRQGKSLLCKRPGEVQLETGGVYQCGPGLQCS